jgi:hypothetical protein
MCQLKFQFCIAGIFAQHKATKYEKFDELHVTQSSVMERDVGREGGTRGVGVGEE